MSSRRSFRPRLRMGFAWVLLFAAGPVWGKLELARYEQLREAERYQIDLADRMYKERKYKPALAEFEKFIKLYQAKSVGSSYAQYMLARCHEHVHNTNTAITEYKAVVDYFPKSPEAPEASLAIGRCHDRMDNVKEAIEAYLETAKQFPKTDAAAQALWGASEIARRKNQMAKCVEFRERIYSEFPESGRRRPVAYWLARHNLFDRNDTEKARKLLQGVFEKPEDAEYVLARTHYYIHPDDNYPHPSPWEWGSAEFSSRSVYYAFRNSKKEVREGALKLSEDCLAVCRGLRANFPASPRARDAWQLMAEVFYNTDRYAEAAAEIRKYLEQFPEDDGYRRLLGRSLMSTKRWDEAAVEYSKYKDGYAGKYHLAEDLRGFGKPAEAVEIWTGMVTEFPNQASAILYQVGYTHQHYTRDYEKAINAYRASEHSPPQHQFRVGECYHAMGKREEAIKAYREIASFFPDHGAEALWRIAHIYEELQMPKYAVAVFRRICSNFPKSNQASRSAQILEHKYNVETGGGVKDGTEVHIEWLDK